MPQRFGDNVFPTSCGTVVRFPSCFVFPTIETHSNKFATNFCLKKGNERKVEQNECKDGRSEMKDKKNEAKG